MTERSVTVRLIALTAQYNGPMKDSARITTEVGTAAELTGTKSGKASKDVNAFGDSIERQHQVEYLSRVDLLVPHEVN